MLIRWAEYIGVGAISAVVGLFPWLMTGMRLPLQNLWDVEVAQPEQMPIALLPFSQYTLTIIVAVIVTGSAVAGGVARIVRMRNVRTRPVRSSGGSSLASVADPAVSVSDRPTTLRSPRRPLPAIVVGVLLVQVGALVQTSLTVSGGLTQGSEARMYLAALVAGTVASILVGLLVLVLIARAPAPGAVIGVSIAAIAFSSWLNSIAVPFGVPAMEANMALVGVLRWAPAIIVGLAIVYAGIGSIGRALAAIVGLLILWIGPALFTAVSAAAGSRVLARYPAEMLDYGAQVFKSALGVWGVSLSLVVVAVVVVLAGVVLRLGVSRWKATRAPAR